MKSHKIASFVKGLLLLIVMVCLSGTALGATSIWSIGTQVDWDGVTYKLVHSACDTGFCMDQIYPEIEEYYSEVNASAGSQYSEDSIYEWDDLFVQATEGGSYAGAATFPSNNELDTLLTPGSTEADSEAIMAQRFTANLSDLGLDSALLVVKVPLLIDFSVDDSLLQELDGEAQVYIGLLNESLNFSNETEINLVGQANPIEHSFITIIDVEDGDSLWLYVGAEMEADANPVPVPSALFLCGAGFAGLIALKRRKG
jgi:hypothetical protein